MTHAAKKDNGASRMALGLMAVAIVALAATGWIAAVVTSDDPGISRLEPWWRGFSVISVLLALLWAAHIFLWRRVPLIGSIGLAVASMMIMIFGVAFFRPLGWGNSCGWWWRYSR
ncbi:hypothetical protein [Rothia aeria]|uniref:hypothetical protein n=1 Tax=Rothia aeria TaxID=172042 RepID=UPI003C7BCB0C